MVSSWYFRRIFLPIIKNLSVFDTLKLVILLCFSVLSTFTIYNISNYEKPVSTWYWKHTSCLQSKSWALSYIWSTANPSCYFKAIFHVIARDNNNVMGYHLNQIEKKNVWWICKQHFIFILRKKHSKIVTVFVHWNRQV